MEVTLELLKFIEEAKQKGYTEEEIRAALIKEGWTNEVINQGFDEVDGTENNTDNANIADTSTQQTDHTPDTGKKKDKNGTLNNKKVSLTLTIDGDVYKVLVKRAKKNMMSTEALAQDIIRRSCVSSKTSGTTNTPEKLDDLLVTIFSRKKSGVKGKVDKKIRA